MNVRLPILALLLLAAPFAAVPAEAAYLSCKVTEGLPTDTAGCFGCYTSSASDALACANITVTCVGNRIIVTVEGQATEPVTWDVWFGTQNAVLYNPPSVTTDSYVDRWDLSAYGGSYAFAWVKIDGRTVARAEIPCIPPF